MKEARCMYNKYMGYCLAIYSTGKNKLNEVKQKVF